MDNRNAGERVDKDLSDRGSDKHSSDGRKNSLKRSRSSSSDNSTSSSYSSYSETKDRKSRKRRSRSSSSSSYSSSSASEKRSKKKKKKKGHKSKKKSKSKKRKEDKKRKKKKKKRKKHKKSSLPGAIDQSQYGKYGIKRREDFYNMRDEFEAWMREVKNIAEIPGGANNRDVMEYFDTYCEDYNTATLPEKYYDLRRWELKQRQKEEKKLSKKRAKLRSRLPLDDEKQAREDRKAEQRREEILKAHALLTAVDKEKAAAMREQELLRRKMKLLFDTGQYEEARKIQDRLRAGPK